MNNCLRLLFFMFLLCSPHRSLLAQQPSGMAVLELFTSEGCSSCPAAEDVLKDIDGEHNHHIYILEFHVDYWDRLGWKDPYSNADYSGRQQAYGRRMGLPNIYTPQAIVNGRFELVGSDKNRLQKIIGDELLKSTAPLISIQAKMAGPNSVTISYRIDGATQELLNIALVQREASSDVKSGENKGRKLQHIQIVRIFKSIDEPGKVGTVSISLPEGLSPGNVRIIAFLQDKKDLHIEAAVQSEAL